MRLLVNGIPGKENAKHANVNLFHRGSMLFHKKTFFFLSVRTCLLPSVAKYIVK